MALEWAQNHFEAIFDVDRNEMQDMKRTNVLFLSGKVEFFGGV